MNNKGAAVFDFLFCVMNKKILLPSCENSSILFGS